MLNNFKKKKSDYKDDKSGFNQDQYKGLTQNSGGSKTFDTIDTQISRLMKEVNEVK
eukprot:CAMPEP_0116929350 /NCGR_PEP_ID=MMETSP0467-20121206/26528_1 /TAXON_ID=283647 /ORGANISM="Mesodinium pulex, Strain SPMC105" /LENGTH=55 /DNA_ID=CAMNT_0004609301 /DNA_START=1424 /DNA_END=1591 /DNA_ORIENTATION=-